MKSFHAMLPIVLGLTVASSSATLPDYDPGIAALAIKQLATISTVPFDGPYRHFRGYLFQTADADFKVAYRKAITQGVPRAVLAANPWALPFAGVMGPSELVELDGTKYLWASTCRPHDCPDGNVYLLYDPIAKTAWGALQSDANVYVFGEPSTAREALLLDLIARGFVDPEEPFPLSGSTASSVRTALKDSAGSVAALVVRHHT